MLSEARCKDGALRQASSCFSSTGGRGEITRPASLRGHWGALLSGTRDRRRERSGGREGGGERGREGEGGGEGERERGGEGGRDGKRERGGETRS